MEDVVLHYKPRDAGQLSSLIWRAETALEPFTCRVLPTFTPWFPSTGDRLLPIRPAKPAPPAHAVTQKTQEDHQTPQNSNHLTNTVGSGDPTSRADTTAHPEYDPKQDPQSLTLANRPHEADQLQKPACAIVITEARPDARPDDQTVLSRSDATPSPRPPQGKPGNQKDVSHIPKTPRTPRPPLGRASPPDGPSPGVATPAPEKRTPGNVSGTRVLRDGAVKRSWSVVARSGPPPPPQSTPPLSRHFHRTVTRHGLHLRQRARWLIGQHNWASSGDMEQVWRQLDHSIRSASLPTCNANIQREQRQIWIFCDVVYSEHVGNYLKEELALSGQITLSVPKLGNILTL